ncbi:riboflavin biosynthesis protein RibD [Klebsormidium nitens]|uniref:5-amino-6-(5-phosphoribosylamino)uracil reductase n=1 Tax=Klebsormidium nitens TaxID=105231 RepID=A0A1Y1HVZ2_KLENI|nr:riboflavin biosynthesis protein RibD [Klebsormidium nitens]|eukprot:GAQ81151.1 riboflavin biosynthesis protein RibD [Klebsormidium nitens]
MAEALHILKASALFGSFTGSQREGPRRGHHSSFPAAGLLRPQMLKTLLMLSSAESIASKPVCQDGVISKAKLGRTVPLSVVAQALDGSGASGGGGGAREAANGKASDSAADSVHIARAIELSKSSEGLTAPHPNAGCVLAHGSEVVGEGFLYAQGTESAEAQAVRAAGPRAAGATAYMNLEPGDCHGDRRAVKVLIDAGVKRAVIGMRHPLSHHRGKAIDALRAAGIVVEVGGEEYRHPPTEEACQKANEALVYRMEFKRPFSVLKYAMTLDGKIAASTGHAAWVSGKESRQKVFAMRGRSDAIIVGGNTVRRDNPRLTTRREGGHLPVRIVMSRTLRLPEDANLWDVSAAPTIVMTQKGAREDFQDRLRRRGVEIVEFDFLTPAGVMDYCYQRGFLQVLWECGGTLSAPAIQAGVIHRVMAFVAPKLIGGITAPTPVGELGFVEMTQAMNLSDVSYDVVGPDLMVSGYLQTPHTNPIRPFSWPAPNQETAPSSVAAPPPPRPRIAFYKAWDLYGAFSNFSPHPITMPDLEGREEEWRSVEHFYQAQKFAGVNDANAESAVRGIREARSSEEAARIGRALERLRPELVRQDWDTAKVEVMYGALCRKFQMHSELSNLLVSTGDLEIVENAPHDFFWGIGRTGQGQNHLGKLLMRVRRELQEVSEKSPAVEVLQDVR